MFNKKINLESTTGALKKRIDELLAKINEDVANCETAYLELMGIIDELDSLEVYKSMMTEALQEKYKEYLIIKESLSKRKANKFIKDFDDVSKDIDRLLKPNEVEAKVKTEIKRNTTKKNLNKRSEELKVELAELQEKNAKGQLTSEEVTRYYLIPEILKEFNNVSI
jgi:hypothetical protein